MAKKGQTVQLQTELCTDEEWEKYLQKPGLLVIDVFSDWCGPCAGMQANLKKIKVEIGGDTLQLAIAKCDGIAALERFRGTSEPTWMLVSGGKMVNFMYGANAPKLTQLITEELRLEKLVSEGSHTRDHVLEVTDRAPEESKRWHAIQSKQAEEEAQEAAKKAEEIHMRLVKESDAILENLGNLGVLVVLPHARDKYMEVMKDLMNEAGLVISISEKLKITPEHIHGISYFLEEDQDLHLPQTSLEHMYEVDTQIMVVKASHGTADNEVPVSVRVLDVIYGPTREPPGEPDCPHQKLLKRPVVEKVQSSPILESRDEPGADGNRQSKLTLPTDKTSENEIVDEQDEQDDSENEEDFLIGIWAPPTRRILSSCFKILFPRMAGPLLIPEPPPKPPFISVCFPIDKRSKVQSMISEWDSEVERYGIFTSHTPEDAQLIAKSFKKFDKSDLPKDGNEEIVIQLARRKSECIMAFALEIPTYISPNIKAGKRECKMFFPEGYDEKEKGEEEFVVEDVEEVEMSVSSVKDEEDLNEEMEGTSPEETSAEEDEVDVEEEEDIYSNLAIEEEPLEV